MGAGDAGGTRYLQRWSKDAEHATVRPLSRVQAGKSLRKAAKSTRAAIASAPKAVWGVVTMTPAEWAAWGRHMWVDIKEVAHHYW